MDPNVLLAQVLVELHNGEREDAEYLILELAEWIHKGGFLPVPAIAYDIYRKRTPE